MPVRPSKHGRPTRFGKAHAIRGADQTHSGRTGPFVPQTESGALGLTIDRVDLAAGVLVFATLKKRQDGHYRAVPVPPAQLDALDLVHGIRDRQARRGKGPGERLWPWSRMTGRRAGHAVMQAVGLDGPQASPKGLRHGFGVAAVSAGIPLNLVQRWLGDAQLTTTPIYADAVGAEEKYIARRMWGHG